MLGHKTAVGNHMPDDLLEETAAGYHEHRTAAVHAPISLPTHRALQRTRDLQFLEI
jgi:hypothetical protein